MKGEVCLWQAIRDLEEAQSSPRGTDPENLAAVALGCKEHCLKKMSTLYSANAIGEQNGVMSHVERLGREIGNVDQLLKRVGVLNH